jgi:hypothetical protein
MQYIPWLYAEQYSLKAPLPFSWKLDYRGGFCLHFIFINKPLFTFRIHNLHNLKCQGLVEIKFIEIVCRFAYLRHWFTIYRLAHYFFEDGTLLYRRCNFLHRRYRKSWKLCKNYLIRKRLFRGVLGLTRQLFRTWDPLDYYLFR